MSKKIRVGLLFGGRSGEHEVSLASASSVYKALNKSRYEVVLIAIDKSGRWLLPDPKPLLEKSDNPMLLQLNETADGFGVVPYPNAKQLVSLSGEGENVPHVDVIVPILHGTFGEDGTVQGLLELAQIPYVGSGVLGSAIGMDKDVTSRLLKEAGVPVVPSLVIRKSAYKKNPLAVKAEMLKNLAFPFFVKPANAGSSVGVHKIKKESDLDLALEDAFSFDTKLIVQKGIDARELEVSVLGNENPRASIVGEVIPKHEFYSYEAKYIDENGAELLIPARNLNSDVIQKIQALAIKAFQVLECRGMARVDFFMDRKTGDLYLNEVNTIPGFTKISMYPKMWEATGLPYDQLLDKLIDLALEHHGERSQLKTSYDIKDWK